MHRDSNDRCRCRRRGMTRDQMIDRERVLDCAQTVLQCIRCTHICYLRCSMLVREPTTRRSPNATARSEHESLLQSAPSVSPAGSHSANRKHLREFVIEPLYGSFVAVTKLPEFPPEPSIIPQPGQPHDAKMQPDHDSGCLCRCSSVTSARTKTTAHDA
jgi:hypothetical protein